MYSRALQVHEKALGANQTSTLDIINNLGNLYADQGKLGEAEAMYSRALKGKEKALGADRTLMFNIVNNLGNLFLNQGKLAEAEAMYSRTLQGYEKALGADHTSTLQMPNKSFSEMSQTCCTVVLCHQLNLEHFGTGIAEPISNLRSLFSSRCRCVL